jgi:hypothetical protein
MDAVAQTRGELLREVRGTRQEAQLAAWRPLHQSLAEESELGWAWLVLAEAEFAAQGAEAAEFSRAKTPGDPRQFLAQTLALALALA